MSNTKLLHALRTMDREWLETEIRQRTMVMMADYGGYCRVLGEYKIAIGQDRTTDVCLAMDGFWEMWVSMCIAKRVKPGSYCILRCEANSYFTVLLARIMDCTVQVPSLVDDQLSESIDLNQLNVKVLWRDSPPLDTPVSFVKLDATRSYPPALLAGSDLMKSSPDLQVCLGWDPMQNDGSVGYLKKLRADFEVSAITGSGDLRDITDDELLAITKPEPIWLKRI